MGSEQYGEEAEKTGDLTVCLTSFAQPEALALS